LHHLGSEDKVEIVVISFLIICSSLPSSIDIQQFPHLKDLELADIPNEAKGEIYILIRSDFYWSFITDGIRQGKGGPTAINSKLDWLLSGPARTFTHNCKTVSNLTVAVGVMDVLSSTDNEELTIILKRFWDTESLGIQDVNELMTINHPFLKDIRHNEGHYMKCLYPGLEIARNYPAITLLVSIV